jgi:hypothetical protein
MADAQATTSTGKPAENAEYSELVQESYDNLFDKLLESERKPDPEPEP